jgi:hypothetical protein
MTTKALRLFCAALGLVRQLGSGICGWFLRLILQIQKRVHSLRRARYHHLSFCRVIGLSTGCPVMVDETRIAIPSPTKESKIRGCFRGAYLPR